MATRLRDVPTARGGRVTLWSVSIRGMIVGRPELDGQRMRVLFVENHAVFAKTVTDLFLGGHDVVVVTTLAAARQQVADRFDVVLVDYDLDDGKGDQLVSELRAAQPRPRIIGVSARPDGNAALLQAGADAVCSKREFAGIQTLLDSIVEHPQ